MWRNTRSTTGRSGRVSRYAGTARAVAAVVCVGMVVAGGCAFGAIAESYRRTTKKEVEAKYTGIENRSFAVVVSADRFIQAEHPEVVVKMTVDLAGRLAEHAGASGWVPGERVLEYQYSHPRWVAMPPAELGAALGAQRLILIELEEYRLHEAGNAYLWDGVATGTIMVFELDSSIPDEPVYREAVSVKFPDEQGFGPADLPREAVNTELARRFVERSGWHFYTHEEPYYPDY